jgi:CHAT domain-containing protein/tetratricopeptide (TPR) repeat protein
VLDSHGRFRSRPSRRNVKQSFRGPAVLRSLVFVSLLLQTGAPGQDAEHPRQLMRLARYVVEGDSSTGVAQRWSDRLARDSSDRGAILGLATLARLSADESTASRLYQRLLRLAPSQADEWGVYARLGLARLSYEQVQMGMVDSLVTEALAGARALHDRAAEGDALQALGNARVDIDKAAGLAYVDSALRVLPATETDVIAGTRCRRGLFLYYMGDRRAQGALDSALAYARRVKAPRGEANCLRAVARNLWGRGLEDSSIAQLRRATVILRRVRDHRALAFALTTLADVLRDHGAYGEAKDALHESLEHARASHYLEGESLALHLLGTLYYSLRDLPTSAEYFDRASAMYDTMHDTLSQYTELSWKANIARDRNDLVRAREWTLEAMDAAKRTATVPWTIELYLSLADIEMLAGRWDMAAAALDSSAQLLRSHGIATWQHKLIYQRGRLALHRGDLDSAERVFGRYLRELGPEDRLKEHEGRAYLADIRARRGDLAGAERELTAAGDALDAWRATLSDRELRLLAFQATASDESDRNSSIARVVAALAEGGRSGAALDLAERRRARELGERLYEASALESSPTSVSLPRKLASSMGAAELAGLLPDDSTALIEYVTGALGAPTTAFFITRHGPVQATVLPPADSLTGAIGRLLALVSKGEETGIDASTLGRALIEPVLAELEPSVTRLIIVPDGPLHRVPWDALRMEDGRYLVERYAIGIAPSLGTLGTLWRTRSRAAPERLLVLADPAFGKPADDSTRAYADLFAASGGLPRLPGSGAEARTVARYAKSAELRLREQASADYLRHTALGEFGVIHLATHALVDDRALGRTALALAPGKSGSGFITPGELGSLKLSADLVVLSACRTAGGVVVDGEGVQGLTAPLLQAGAHSIVATSWRVGDQSTVRFVDQFYQELAKGKPVVDALRAAKLTSLKKRAPSAVWAAFTVVGDPLIVVPLRKPASPVALWAGGGMVAIIFITAALSRRRRHSARGESQISKG